MNNFSIDMTNKWAGGVVTIDEEAATIMATAMGAGHKNVDNSFTGVLMGDIQLNAQTGIDSGLFGFSNGQMVFKLNKDAEFYVGSNKDNYISFKDEEFDLKTQTLKLNALADSFIIDSTGTSQAKFEQKIYTTVIDGKGQNQTVESIVTEDVDNAVIAAHNNFIVTADGKIYAKNICGFEMASGGYMTLSGTTQVVNEAGDVSFTFEEIGADLKDINTALPAVQSLVEVKDNMVENLGSPEVPDYEINIKAGKIGSWSLTENFIYAQNGDGNITALIGANINNDVLKGIEADTEAGGKISDKDSGNPEDWYLWFKGKGVDSGFGVDKNGTLYAKNGIFTGQIESDTGIIGDWNLTEGNLIYSSTVAGTHYYKLISGRGTSGFSDPNNIAPTGWSLWFGSDQIMPNLKFGVTNEGIMYATNAIIDGTIVAKDGRIGGFNIGPEDEDDITDKKPNAIYTLDSTKQYVTALISGSGVTGKSSVGDDNDETTKWKLWFGRKDENGDVIGTFGVTENGIMYANSAIISGTIVATGGSIGGWTVASPPNTGTSFNGGIYYRTKEIDNKYYQLGLKLPLKGEVTDETLTNPAFYLKYVEKKYVTEYNEDIGMGLSKKGTNVFSLDFQGNLTANKAIIGNSLVYNYEDSLKPDTAQANTKYPSSITTSIGLGEKQTINFSPIGGASEAIVQGITISDNTIIKSSKDSSFEKNAKANFYMGRFIPNYSEKNKLQWSGEELGFFLGVIQSNTTNEKEVSKSFYPLDIHNDGGSLIRISNYEESQYDGSFIHLESNRIKMGTMTTLEGEEVQREGILSLSLTNDTLSFGNNLANININENDKFEICFSTSDNVGLRCGSANKVVFFENDTAISINKIIQWINTIIEKTEIDLDELDFPPPK